MNSTTDIIRKTRWYIRIRLLVLITVVFSGLIVKIINRSWDAELRLDLTLGVAAIATNGIFFLLSRQKAGTAYYRRLMACIIIFDLFLVDLLIFVKGGIESRSAILFVIPILMSAAVFGRASVYLTSIASIVLYDVLIIATYLGIMPVTGAYHPELNHYLPYVIESIIFFSTILLITCLVIDFMTKLLIENERLASERLAGLKRAQAIAKLGSWEWDQVHSTLTWSDEMYQLLRIPRNTPVATYDNYLQYIHPLDKKMASTTISSAIRKQRPYALEHRTHPDHGPVRYLRSDGQPIFNESGALVKIIGTVQDITEAKQLEEAKSDFVALASHQLRTPATAVKQYLGMLLDNFAGKLSEQQQKLVTIAYDSNERQLSIVDDLLHVAQVDSDKIKLRYEPVDIIALLRAIVDEEVPQFQKLGQTTTLRTRYKELFYRLDANHFRMALENIIDNAHKYTPHNKKITISVTKTNRGVTISVTDQGVGIAKRDLPRLFRKFSRIDNPLSALVGGSGLGLYWAAKIISLHGGKITAESVLGKGSTFTIALPRSLEAKLK